MVCFPSNEKVSLNYRIKPTKNSRRPSRTLTSEQVTLVKRLLLAGELQHRIAAQFDVNQGRISEISTGKRRA